MKMSQKCKGGFDDAVRCIKGCAQALQQIDVCYDLKADAANSLSFLSNAIRADET